MSNSGTGSLDPAFFACARRSSANEASTRSTAGQDYLTFIYFFYINIIGVGNRVDLLLWHAQIPPLWRVEIHLQQ